MSRREELDGRRIELVLTHVEKVLPLVASAWEKVEVVYNRAAEGQPRRDVASIRLKFTALKNVRKPTSDPTCPSTIIRAKRIQCLIDSAASMASLGDDASTSDDANNDHEQLDDGDDYDELASDSASDANHSSIAGTQ